MFQKGFRHNLQQTKLKFDQLERALEPLTVVRGVRRHV